MDREKLREIHINAITKLRKLQDIMHNKTSSECFEESINCMEGTTHEQFIMMIHILIIQINLMKDNEAKNNEKKI